MTDYVIELMRSLETSWKHGNYNSIIFSLINKMVYTCTIEDITYINRYFFKITTEASTVFVNINNLSSVELQC